MELSSVELLIWWLTDSIQGRDRPAKQVRGTTQVEPILFEQGFGSYIWLGVLCPPVRKA